jgi:nifR3 family TIM-barrel protein
MTSWQKLKKEKGNDPIFSLAPMADVTDPAFREIISKIGKPDVFWTEFVSADGLFLGGFDALSKDLYFDKTEKPIVAQFFTSKPEMMEKASKLAKDLGFDGVDINMGCPDKSVEKQGAGASLIKNPSLAKELILSAKQGSDLPVSVKTRVGYNKVELSSWMPSLLEVNPSVITIHARTRKEMSLVPANWQYVKDAVKIRDDLQKDLDQKTLIFGNGDVNSLDHGRKLCAETGADGAMLGRAIFGNPWLFSEKIPTTKEKLEVLILHTFTFEKLCAHKSFSIMKKHYKAYVSGFDGAKELRVKLMEANNAKEVEILINDFLKSNFLV